MHNLKVESYVLFSRHSEVFKPGRQDFQITLTDCSEEARREARIYGSFCNKVMKRFLLIKENQISQVNEVSAFQCMERGKSVGSLKSFLGYAPQLSGAGILGFLILSLLRAYHRG